MGKQPLNGSGFSFQQTFVRKETRNQAPRKSAWEVTAMTDNEHSEGKRIIGLNWRKYRSAHPARILVHFLAVLCPVSSLLEN